MADSGNSLGPLSTVFVNAMCAIVVVYSASARVCESVCVRVNVCCVYCTAVFCIIVLNIQSSSLLKWSISHKRLEG